MLPPASRIRALIDLVFVALVVLDVVRLPLDAAWDQFGHLGWYDRLSLALFCAEMLTHSPAAIEMAPATAPAKPARRTMVESTPLAANPRMSETFETKPSLIPKTAARARPPDTER